jgi:hypothetical protein
MRDKDEKMRDEMKDETRGSSACTLKYIVG